MPDITMCCSVMCHKTTQCYRHKDSGTKAGHWQSVCDFTPTDSLECKRFWPIYQTKVADSTHPQGEKR
jgi:hypothetical protein